MFDNNNILDSVLSVLSLGLGAVAIAAHTGPLVILCGVILFLCGVLGLTFGNW